MLRLTAGVLCAIGIGAWVSCAAAEPPFKPQHVTVRPSIEAGANVFTSPFVGAGAGSIHVFAASDLSYKGSMSTGAMGQMLVSRDGKSAYTASVYMKRVVSGDLEMVLQIYDVASLSAVREIALPPKLSMSLAVEGMLSQSADGRYLYIQNATPATSITVVDLIANKVVGEIPAPGCFGIYPSVAEYRFSTVCGDGSFASFTLNSDGSAAQRAQSTKIFDVDKDAIFIPSARVGDDLVFVSFNGNVYRVNDTGPQIHLVERLSMTTGVQGGWAPGGAQLIGYNKANNVLFVGMHPNAREGSHKDPAQEIWAYDLTTHRLLSRSSVADIISLTVTDAQVPVIYASKSRGLIRFDADPAGGFALKQSRQVYNPGPYNNVIVFRQ